ncbi:MAG: hypothetical protein ACKO0V_07100, partial [bacterium]
MSHRNISRRKFTAASIFSLAVVKTAKSTALMAPARRLLAADKGSVAMVDDSGQVFWQYQNKAEAHDLHLLPNGNVLLPVGRTKVVEITPENKIVWSYDAQPRMGYNGRVEVHAFQPLPDGR